MDLKSLLSTVLNGAIVILIYDTVGALLSRSNGFNYGWLAIGSVAFYGLFGFVASRRSGWASGPVAGALLGFFDATIGWAISWTIGPGKPSEEMNSVMMVMTVVFVTGLATVFGLIGGLLSLVRKPNV